MNTDTDAVTRMLKRAIDLLDTALGDSDPMIDDDMPQEEIEAAYPVMCAMQILTNLLTIQCTPTAPAQSCGDAEQADEAVTEVGFITHDELHGWHFAPTVAWTWLGKGRALYARAKDSK